MIVGIDLGTTHSLVGRWSAAGVDLYPNALGTFLTPSVVAVDPQGGVCVGAAAHERLLADPGCAVAAFKRDMGSAREFRLGGRSFRPEQLSALVLRALLDDVQAATGERPQEAVISVPAYFSDAQRKATRVAGELAGIRVERLVNEPTAAALAYGLQEGQDGSRFLVLDLGGGTFDVSVLELYDGVVEVHASAGDNYLGGEDFLDVLQAACLKDLALPGEPAPAERAMLRGRLEQAKRRLSAEPELELELAFGSGTRRWRIGQERFEELSRGLLARLRTPVERALRDARLAPAQLDQVVLVGGASRMPMVVRLFTRMLGRLPLRHVHPDEAIANGACVMAAMKARDAALRETVITDVSPYTLGVEVCEDAGHGQAIEGIYSPIIERNSPVPVSRVERYLPVQDGQSRIHLKIYQGEHPNVAGNIRLGELEVPLLPRPRAENPVDVRFTYDINGLLEVEANVLAEQRSFRVLIENNPGSLTPEAIAARLAELQRLKLHPREDQANLAVLARAERLYAEALGEGRRELQAAIVEFRGLLESQDLRAIQSARARFAAWLDAREREPGW